MIHFPKILLSKIFTRLLTNTFLRSLLLCVLGIYIFLICYFHNPLDDSLNVASDNQTLNLLGIPGAFFSDLLIQFIGKSAYLISYCCLYWSYLLYQYKEIKYFRLKLFAMLIALLSFTVILDIYNAGGVVGLIIFNAFETLISRYLALLIFLIFLPLTMNLNLIDLSSQQTDNQDNQDSAKVYFKKTEIKMTKAYQHSKTKLQQDEKSSKFILPTIELLKDFKNNNYKQETPSQLEEKANELLKTLTDFGVNGKIVSINRGPVVTLYEFEPAAGTKSSRVIGLADDVARSLSALSARISTISGKNALGIELPNMNRLFFSLKEIIETDEYNDHKITLPIILGKDLSGKPFVVDLAKMPHLLIAGTTGSGKSVGINTMILSLLYRYTPEECKFIMIDPKMLELSVYDDIPHLLTPVVTVASKAVIALKWAVKEMENRYKLMSQLGVRNITNYNQRLEESKHKMDEASRKFISKAALSENNNPDSQEEPAEPKKMPFIVIVVDEMADLMLVAGKDIEGFIQRLAQMARAAGIHLITATQRPSVDVITGVIKANFPSRISFKVTSKIDSRTILGEMGSEQLLGMGDMLYMGNGSKIIRVHGPFVDDIEVENIVNFLKSQGKPEYISSVTEGEDEEMDFINQSSSGGDDNELYRQAVQIIKKDRKCSTSYIQRSLRIGYNRAALLIERMEKEGLISEPNHSGKREIFI